MYRKSKKPELPLNLMTRNLLRTKGYLSDTIFTVEMSESVMCRNEVSATLPNRHILNRLFVEQTSSRILHCEV